MDSKIALSPTQLTGSMISSMDSNGFHILWSVVDATTSVPVDPTGITINFFLLAPAGEEIAFDGNPYGASEYQVRPSVSGESSVVKAVAVGLTGNKRITLTLKSLF